MVLIKKKTKAMIVKPLSKMSKLRDRLSITLNELQIETVLNAELVHTYWLHMQKVFPRAEYPPMP